MEKSSLSKALTAEKNGLRRRIVSSKESFERHLAIEPSACRNALVIELRNRDVSTQLVSDVPSAGIWL